MEAIVSETDINFNAPEQAINTTPKLRTSFDKNIKLYSEPNLDWMPSEEDKKVLSSFHKLLEKFNESPDDLLDMPIIPLSEDERKTVSVRELEDDDELRRVVSNTDYNGSNYKDWFNERGFDSSLLLAQVDTDSLTAIDDFQDDLRLHIEDYGHNYENFEPTQISLKKALEIIRVRVVGETYLEEIKNKAMESLQNISPELMPTNPVEIIHSPRQVRRGQYLGQYKGIHYLSMNSSLASNPYLKIDSASTYDIELDESVFSHEMFHAKQSEVSGKSISMLTLNKPIEDLVEINVNDKDEILSKLNSAPLDVANNDNSKNQMLAISLFEGEAILAQLTLCREKIINTTDSNIKNSLTRVENILINSLRLRDDDGNKFEGCNLESISIYRRGYDLIHPLQREFGLRNLIPILSDVDTTKLMNIHEGDVELKNIMADPRLLPGLEKNPYIIQSLKQTPPKIPTAV